MSLIKREPGLLGAVEPFLFDRLLDPIWPGGRMQSRFDDGPMAPRIDIVEKDDAYVVDADLPGMTKDDIDVSMDGTVLTDDGFCQCFAGPGHADDQFHHRDQAAVC